MALWSGRDSRNGTKPPISSRLSPGFCVKRELPRATRVSFASVRFSLDYNQSRPAKSECRLIDM